MAGGLFAHEFGLILTPSDAGFQRSFEYVIMTVLGGRGSISGVMLAASLVTALPEFLREFEQYRLIRLRARVDRDDARARRKGCWAFAKFGISGSAGRACLRPRDSRNRCKL